MSVLFLKSSNKFNRNGSIFFLETSFMGSSVFIHASVQSYCTAVVVDIPIHFLGLLPFLWISNSSPGKGAWETVSESLHAEKCLPLILTLINKQFSCKILGWKFFPLATPQLLKSLFQHLLSLVLLFLKILFKFPFHCWSTISILWKFCWSFILIHSILSFYDDIYCLFFFL